MSFNPNEYANINEITRITGPNNKKTIISAFKPGSITDTFGFLGL